MDKSPFLPNGLAVKLDGRSTHRERADVGPA
jgi:hypothetical protein